MKVLFIRDLPSAITEYQLFEFFSDISGGRVERTKKVNDFAFVHFTDRQSAEEAKEAADLLLLDVSTCLGSRFQPVRGSFLSLYKPASKGLARFISHLGLCKHLKR